MKYRMYIDETGNHDMKHVDEPNHRFLGLTGIICTLNAVMEYLIDELEEIKRRYFPYDPDNPPILHRKDLIHKKYPFSSLRDSHIEYRFNSDIMNLLRDFDYKVISVVIDKKEHRDRYTIWRFHPYHYCLQVMLERYILFLESNNATGDVMAESRGGREDRQLKESFQRLMNTGTDYVIKDRFSGSLTSSQLKVRPK